MKKAAGNSEDVHEVFSALYYLTSSTDKFSLLFFFFVFSSLGQTFCFPFHFFFLSHTKSRVSSGHRASQEEKKNCVSWQKAPHCQGTHTRSHKKKFLQQVSKIKALVHHLTFIQKKKGGGNTKRCFPPLKPCLLDEKVGWTCSDSNNGQRAAHPPCEQQFPFCHRCCSLHPELYTMLSRVRSTRDTISSCAHIKTKTRHLHGTATTPASKKTQGCRASAPEGKGGKGALNMPQVTTGRNTKKPAATSYYPAHSGLDHIPSSTPEDLSPFPSVCVYGTMHTPAHSLPHHYYMQEHSLSFTLALCATQSHFLHICFLERGKKIKIKVTC